MASNTKIVRLTSTNVKRLKAVEIKPDGNLVVIGGDNAQGKSSVLDSILYALAGNRAVCATPIREGASTAEVMVELDTLTVRRRFTKKGTTLTVEGKDGTKFSSPQAVLDELVGAVGYDPMSFIRDKDKQLDRLKALLGIDFAAADAERKEAYDKRTGWNREVKRLEFELNSAPAYPDAPAAVPTTADITAELTAARAHNQANEKKRQELNLATKERDQLFERIALLRKELESFSSQLEEVRGQMIKAEGVISGLVDQDETSILAKFDQVEEIGKQVRSNQRRAEIAKGLDIASREADAKSRRIEEIDEAKRKTLADANMPVEGLSFDSNGVLLNGLPLDQASSSEQLRVSVAIGLAMNPKLRVLIARDASLLDNASMAELQKIAQDHDAQIWAERVGKLGPQITIEDGMVVGED
jgi:DNA repair exonuclease SbcCD ATPase subunit